MNRSCRFSSGGFTLLEMMLVMLVLTMLVGAIFGIVKGTVELADDMTVEQSRESRVRGFATYCERLFRTLPARAVVRHELKESGGRYLSRLTLEHVPSGIGAAGASSSNRLVLETEEAVDGYLRVVLTVVPDGEAPVEPVRLVLLEGVAACEWEFHDSQSDHWMSIWNPPLAGPSAAKPRTLDGAESGEPLDPRIKRPELVTLKLKLGTGNVRQFAFWTPPAGTRHVKAAER